MLAVLEDGVSVGTFSDASCPPAAVVGHWAEVWTLCEALWGRAGPSDQDGEPLSEYEQQLQRRRAFSDWLSHGASRRVEKEVALVGRSRHTEAVFSYLTGRRISAACRLAQKEGEEQWCRGFCWDWSGSGSEW